MTLALALQLAADDPALDPTTGRGPEWGKAAPVALLIILLMGVALFVLIRSMNSQLRKVPSAFMRGDKAPAEGAAVEAAAPVAGEGSTAGTAETPAEVPPPGDGGAGRS